MNRILSNFLIESYIKGKSFRKMEKECGMDRHKISDYLKNKGMESKNKVWNKGLSKENDDRIKSSSIKISNTLKKRKLSSMHKFRIGTKSKLYSHSIESKNKIRLVHLGKKNKGQSDRMKLNNPMKTKRCKEMLIKRISGENNYNWQGGKSFEPYDLGFNNKFKREIRKRDNQICMLCGIHREKLNRALDIHHINYDKKMSIKENCISLCRNCHSKNQINKNHWIRFFQNLLSERYGYKYSYKNEPIINLNEEIKNEK